MLSLCGRVTSSNEKALFGIALAVPGLSLLTVLKFKSHAASIKQGATVLGTFHIYKCEESFITSRKERLRQISEPHCTSWGVLGGGSMIHQKICEAIKPFAESAQNLKQTAGDWAIESLYTCRYCTATCSQQQCTSISPVILNIEIGYSCQRNSKGLQECEWTLTMHCSFYFQSTVWAELFQRISKCSPFMHYCTYSILRLLCTHQIALLPLQSSGRDLMFPPRPTPTGIRHTDP